jgi:hypothetical protein
MIPALRTLNYLELFVDDCGYLGFNRHLIPAHLDCGYEDLVTANGNIRVPKILVEVLVMATDNTPIGAPFLVKAALPNAWSFQRQEGHCLPGPHLEQLVPEICTLVSTSLVL